MLVRAPDDGSLCPDVLFFDPATEELVMLSDDGDEAVGALKCKDKNLPADLKSFRVKRMAWTNAGAARP